MKKTQIYLLHGWAVNTNNVLKWQPLIEKLAQAEIEAIFLPLPGLSSSLAEIWNLDNYVSWVLHQLPDRPVILLGHSFGGQIAIRLAARHPERVKQLFLIDSAGIRDLSFKARAKRLSFGVLAKVGQLITKNERARKLLYKLVREKDYYNADPLLKQTMVQVIKTDIQDEAARIVVPTFIIWGERDQITPLWMGQRFYHLIKGSRLEIIALARHSPQFTHVDEVVRLIANSVVR